MFEFDTESRGWARVGSRFRLAPLLSVAADQEGTVYVGTAGAGVHRLPNALSTSAERATPGGADTRQISVYPNPAVGSVNVSIEISGSTVATVSTVSTIEMIDSLGRIVRSRQFLAGVGKQVLRLDTTGLPAGLYVVRISGSVDRSDQGPFMVLR